MREPLRATFFALRHRGRHGVLLRATIAYATIVVALFGATYFAVSFAWGDLLSSPSLERSPAPDFGHVLWLIPIVFVVVFLGAVATASYEAACLRWLIRGEARGLTLDDDTWRVYGAYWIWWGIHLAWGLAYLILQALLTRLFGAGHWSVWVGICVLGFAALVSVVALAPATAAGIAKKRLAFFEATQASDDRFLSLLASYAVIVGGQWLIQQGATIAWWTWALGPDWIETFRTVSDYVSLMQAESLVAAEAMQRNAAIAWAISGVSLVVSLVGMVLLFGVNARAVLLAIEEGRIQPGVA